VAILLVGSHEGESGTAAMEFSVLRENDSDGFPARRFELDLVQSFEHFGPCECSSRAGHYVRVGIRNDPILISRYGCGGS
jgi:hypothetical protein